MDWESNDFDWMSSDSGGGYSADENGFDFGNGGQNVNWDFGSTPDNSWDQFQFGGQDVLPGYNQQGDWINDQTVAQGGQSIFGAQPNFAPQPQQAGTQDFLSRLFSSPGLLGKGIAALFEGSQNKQKQAAFNKIARNSALDPFGSQRPFYQQQLQQAVTNPYDSPIVRSQVDNMQRMQAIKDAAAGRRSNSLSTAPGVLAAQAEIAQKYMNSLQGPAGANIAPQGQTIANMLAQGANAGINGYTSPLANVFGNASRTMELEDLIRSMKG